MTEIPDRELSDVAGTLFISLYIRAIESQRPDALVKDERAEAVIRQLDQDALRKTLALTEDSTRLVMVLKSRDFDCIARAFLSRHPDATIVHIACGLDTRFDRLDNGRVEWYDLDLPEVIKLRRKLVGGESGRHHFLACSALDYAWLDEIGNQCPVLFIAEGIFMYFDEAQVKSLVLAMKEHFPGAQLVFDAYSPFLRWSHNVKVKRTGVGAPLHWALKHPQDLERWGNSAGGGIRLLDQRYPFQSPEPRLRRSVKLRLIPFIARGIGVFHYQL